jgi:Zn-dependent peptidase ImmA (M78 family)
VDYATARVSVAHELGHVLVHLRANDFDEATVRMPSSPEEECIAEYRARLLLMPSRAWLEMPMGSNLAEEAVIRSNIARVTIRSAVARLGDPDVGI